MALIAKELINHEEIFSFSGVYEDYIRKGTADESWISNTNKLVKFYPGADGLKTGWTDDAGSCIAATAMKNDLRLIVVSLGYKNNNDRNSETMELLNLVCDAIKININNIEEKESILKLIYQIRYFSLIYVSKNKQVKDIIDINIILRMIITKGCKNKYITIFSRNIKENYDIIKNIFDTDIIELEKIYLKFIQKQETTVLEIYDEENLYKEIDLPKIEELNVKLNKKNKVVI